MPLYPWHHVSRSRASSIVGVAAAALLIAPPLAAQLEVTPFAAAYVPLSDLARTEGPAVRWQQQPGAAFGARLTLWRGRFGVEGALGQGPSAVRGDYASGGNLSVDARLTTGGVKALFALNAPGGSGRRVAAGVGLGRIVRGGDFYAGTYSVDNALLIGALLQQPLRGRLALRTDLEYYRYRLHARAEPGTVLYGQRDLALSLGLSYRLTGGR